MVRFPEAHKLRVAAVPVTDTANGGKAGNITDLTAVRWRLLPFPGFVMIPIVLLMMKARLRWDTPFFATLNLKATTRNDTNTHRFARSGYEGEYSVAEYGAERTYEVNPLLRACGERITARFVPVRTIKKLRLSVGSEERPLRETFRDITVDGQTIITGGASEVTVDVPRNKTVRLNLTNRARGLRVDAWLVKLPADFAVLSVTERNSNQIAPGRTLTAQISYRNTGATPEANPEIIFVTTDARH